MIRLSGKSGIVSMLILCVLLISTCIYGQKVLSHSDYDTWQQLRDIQLAPDGSRLAYRVGPAQGDQVAIITQVEAPYDSIVIQRGGKVAFSPDSRFAAIPVSPFYAATLKARRAGKKKEKLPKDTLVVIRFDGQPFLHIDQLVSFSFPADRGHHLAVLHTPLPQPDTAAADSTFTDGLWVPKKAKKSNTKGQTLWVLNLQSGDTLSWSNADQYQWAPNGNYLAFTVEADSTSPAGVYVLDVGKNSWSMVHDSAEAYQHLSWSQESDQLLFFAHRDTADNHPIAWSLHSWEPGQSMAKVIVDSTTTGIPQDWWVSPHKAAIATSNTIYLGLMPRPFHVPDDSLGDFEKPAVDIWSWTDDRIMPRQLDQLKSDLKPHYWARWDNNRIIPLADTAVPDVSFTPFYQGDYALATTDLPYRFTQSWSFPWYQQAYAIHPATGERKWVADSAAYGLQISPFGKYIIGYDTRSQQWWVYNNYRDEKQLLTASLTHPLYQQDHDAPHPARPFGLGGWLAGDAKVLIYDEYDIWTINPDKPSDIECITAGLGRATNTTFRLQRVRKDTSWFDPTAPMLLRGFCHTDKASGYIWLDPDGRLDTLTWGAMQVSGIEKARSAATFVWQQEDFNHYPEAFTWQNGQPIQRTVTNPQQADYNWGSVRLMNWKDFDGEEREGLLYLPANFDSTQQYPMLVYFYEQVSDRLHRHYYPAPSRSVINPAMYAGNGYVVFMPDIHYTVGYPGKSAYNAILSGTQAVLAKGFVDPQRMGLQGQSWGGYQVAYMVTQTNQFAAAMAGAPVSNMFSAYGGIRWGSGLSRAFQYERTQSRIGATPWENPHLYWQNSPLFFADQVATPLLIMHNDDDGAVPWYQGIEMYIALRRMGKPVWLLNYNGDKHNLTKWPNRVDLSIRMQQFFDHYLKGVAAPEWLKNGVPAIQKGKVDGYEIR